MEKKFIIDFDSTFICCESLEELANISLKNNPQKKQILEKIKQITNQGMNGEISFPESLDKRLKLLKANKNHVEKTIKILNKKITKSINSNKDFFQKNEQSIYIISGGFNEIITKVVKKFNIKKEHILANDLIFDKENNIIGINKKNVLSEPFGKVKAVKSLNLKSEIIVIGDGITDFEIKEKKVASKFIYFSENILRENVAKKADFIAPNFDEILFHFNYPTRVSFPKNRIKTVLFEKIDNKAVEAFENEGYLVEYYEKSFTNNELIEKIKDAHLIGVRSNTKITKEVLEKCPKLLGIGTFCIGTDQTDLKIATEKGIAVFNAPYSNTRSVVELIIGEIIALNRNIFNKNNELHSGIWNKDAKFCHEIRGKKLGIIGFGNIGSQLSIVAEALGMEVYFYDIVEKLAIGNAKKINNIYELLKKCDVITIHVDGNPKNVNLIGEKEFKAMKDGCIFLNASRGKVVDINALCKYLKNGKIRSCAIDVFPQEPKSKEEIFSSPLQSFPQAILTPHIGGSTEEAQKNIGEFVSSKLIDFINTGNTYLSVNLPNIQLPSQSNCHRLLHLHQNVPGILAQINSIMANYKINIEGQYLKTNEKIGYVITDINTKHNNKALLELKNIKNTIKLRVLY